MDLLNTVLNDVLCFISSAKNSMTVESIETTASTFYTEEAVKDAKEIMCNISGERAVIRRKTPNQPNIVLLDVKDIMRCFKIIEEGSKPCPEFVARGIGSFPPRGYEALAPTLCALRDEVTALRTEASELRKAVSDDARSLNDTRLISQEINDIKTMMMRILNSNDSYAGRENPPNITLDPSVTPYADAVASNTQSHPDNVSIPASNQSSTSNLTSASNQSSISQQSSISNHSSASNNSTTSNPSSTSNQSSTFYSTNAASNANSSKWINVDRRPFANARKKNDFNLTRRRIANDQKRGGNDPIQASRNQHGPRTRRNIIVGTKNSDSVIGGGERVLDIYVGGCGKECTTENITSYCDEHGISIKKCELLQSSSEWNRSFKVSATANDRDKLLLGEFWPQGIFVRRFFKARNRASD